MAQAKNNTTSKGGWYSTARLEKLTQQPEFAFETKLERKVQSKVKLRFKELKNGEISAYFDIYNNGKRTYNFLGLRYYPEKSKNDKATQTANDETKSAILERFVVEVKAIARDSNNGWIDRDLEKTKIVDWLRIYEQKQIKRKRRFAKTYFDIVARLIEEYNGNIQLKAINKSYCLGFKRFLQNYVSNHTGKVLAESSQFLYFQLLNLSLNEAKRDKIINANPIDEIPAIDKPKNPKTQRTHLTIDELKSIMAVKSPNENVKGAFMFSCFCGLRISDIEALTWRNVIKDNNGQPRIEIKMQKTQLPIYQTLNDEAIKWLPGRGEKTIDDKVFDLPTYTSISRDIKKIAKLAGLTKAVTFHTARHTFATQLLESGGNIYNISKLLGHTDIKTTQIYAEVADIKKDETVNLLNGLLD